MKELSRDERRGFLLQAASMIGITVCAGSMAAALSSCEKDESKVIATHGSFTVNVASESGLAAVGDGIKKSVGTYNASKPVIIIKTASASFLVVSSVCNHAGCEVSAPKANGANIVCDFNDNHCGHNAEFNPNSGLQVVGPSGSSASGGLTVLSSSFDSATQILTINF